VGRRSTWLGIAISLSALDAALATYYGGVVWRAFAVVIWSKLLVLLLVAVWATTLLHVWTHACSQLRQANRERQVPVKGLSTELAEDIDV
jgi:hypothetical protein